MQYGLEITFKLLHVQHCHLNIAKLVTFQEYVDYYGTAGVQHIALNTSDIITAVSYHVYTIYTTTNKQTTLVSSIKITFRMTPIILTVRPHQYYTVLKQICVIT